MSRAFDLVKESVDIVDAAQRYGIVVNRFGKAHCPWHPDKTPSLSFYGGNRRYHCFGCGADGDVIDLVCRQNDLSPLDAVRELNQTYRLGLELDAPENPAEIKRTIRTRDLLRAQKELFDLWDKNTFLILSAYFRALLGWRRDLAPRSPFEALDPRFVEALHQMDYIDYLLDEVYINGNRETKAAFFRSHEKLIRAIEQRLLKGGVPYAGRTAAGPDAAASFRPVVVEGGLRPERAA